MPQLIMRWKNDGAPKKQATLPENIKLITIKDVENGIDAWCDVVKYMEKDRLLEFPEGNEAFYKRVMPGESPWYSEDKCFFLTVKDKIASTFTVICNYETKEGYIHMVSANPDFRGLGLGNLMSDIAGYVLKKEGMETAYLTTDDWRIPAIKTYLKGGFTPDLTSDESFPSRWAEIFKIIENKQ